MTAADPAATTTAGDLCSLYVDLPPYEPAIEPGDWVLTDAGSRYLIATAREVHPRHPRSTLRWQLTVHRLPKRCAVPADVRALVLRWYRR